MEFFLVYWNCGDINIQMLTHWGLVTHICLNKLTIIGSDNGVEPDRHQAIIWTNVGMLVIWPLGTNFSEILIKMVSSFKKMHLKMSSAKCRPSCLGLNELMHQDTKEAGASGNWYHDANTHHGLFHIKISCHQYRNSHCDILQHLIFTMEIPMLVRFISNQGPW